jgi:hypothetical protein
MSTPDAAAHLDAAIRALCLEAYGGANPCDLKPVAHFTIAEDLRRIDRAIGPSRFSRRAPLWIGDRCRRPKSGSGSVVRSAVCTRI